MLRPIRLSLSVKDAYDLAGFSRLYLLGLAVLLLAPAAGIAAARGFDGLYGQDAFAYFDYATTSVRDSILHARPLEAFFWPPGYPVLVALVSLATGPLPLAGQIVSVVMGALVPVLTVLLARELWPEDMLVPLLAGVLVALSGQLWQSSIVVMADTTGLALATLAALSLVRYARSGHLAWLVAASAAIAYAMLARWIYGLVAVPFGLYALLVLRRRANRHQAALHALAGLIVGAVLLVPVLGPPLLGLVAHPAEPASFAGNLQVYSWSPLNALRRDFFTADGHLSYALPNGVYYAIAPANLALLGPLLAPWLAVGLWLFVRQRDAERLLLIVGWAAVVYAFHAGAPWQNFRFTLAYLPPLAVLAASGLTWTWRSLDRRPASVVALCAAAGLLVSGVAAVRLVEGFIDRKDEDVALVRWVQAQTSPNAQLFSFGPTLTLRHYTSLPTFDLFDVSATDVSSILAAPTPTYLLLDERSVERQWLDAAPSANFHLLRDGPGLTPIGSLGGYTLYRVMSR
jgi:4-amino-4-deoxy-L-arabinose transferase-like glycosyltransferase